MTRNKVGKAAGHANRSGRSDAIGPRKTARPPNLPVHKDKRRRWFRPLRTRRVPAAVRLDSILAKNFAVIIKNELSNEPTVNEASLLDGNIECVPASGSFQESLVRRGAPATRRKWFSRVSHIPELFAYG